MKNNFLRGIDYAADGVCDFYKHRFLWKYVAFPWAVLLVLYASVFTWIIRYLQPSVAKWLSDAFTGGFWEFLAGPLEKVLVVLSWITAMIILALSSNLVFELTGSLFFPRMLREYEQRVLGIHSAPRKFMEIIRNFSDMIKLNMLIVICFLLLSLVLLFLPLIGFIVFIALMGYLYSILFMSEACFSRKCRLTDVKYIFMRKKGLMYGFGMFSFFLIQLPLLSIFLYPGFMLGGSKMFHSEIGK